MRPVRPAHRAALALVTASLAALTAGPAMAQHDGESAHDGVHSMAGHGTAVARAVVPVILPTVRLREHRGQLVRFDTAIDGNRPVLLNFIYTSCTTICLPMSQLFAAAQERLGPGADQVQMVSVSIDPGQDTPATLREYAGRFHAGAQWTFLTGSQPAIDEIQRAFNVYRPDKMSHTPVTFVRPRGSRQWVRLDGFASPEQLVGEALGPMAHEQ
jgi:protein SCO1/2